MHVGNLTNSFYPHRGAFDLPLGAVRADEAALVAELRAGSEEAFAYLIQQYHRPVYSLLARSVRDQADAADITQEVFLKIFRGIHTFHGESSLKTWIYRIALHEASNGQRWWSRHKKCEVTLEASGCLRVAMATKGPRRLARCWWTCSARRLNPRRSRN